MSSKSSALLLQGSCVLMSPAHPAGPWKAHNLNTELLSRHGPARAAVQRRKAPQPPRKRWLGGPRVHLGDGGAPRVFRYVRWATWHSHRDTASHGHGYPGRDGPGPGRTVTVANTLKWMSATCHIKCDGRTRVPEGACAQPGGTGREWASTGGPVHSERVTRSFESLVVI